MKMMEKKTDNYFHGVGFRDIIPKNGEANGSVNGK